LEEIVNKVAQSALRTVDLDDYLNQVEVVFFDLKPFLFQEMILREKDFRLEMKDLKWEAYHNKHVIIGCSVDAIIPTWAYMLVATKLAAQTSNYRFGDTSEVERMKIDNAVSIIANEDFENAKVVIKGCGGLNSRDYAYTEVTKVLVNQVTSLMYGEPCSTVPIFKKPRSKS